MKILKSVINKTSMFPSAQDGAGLFEEIIKDLQIHLLEMRQDKKVISALDELVRHHIKTVSKGKKIYLTLNLDSSELFPKRTKLEAKNFIKQLQEINKTKKIELITRYANNKPCLEWVQERIQVRESMLKMIKID